MKQTSDLTEDEAMILVYFADVYDDGGIEGLGECLMHCKIKMIGGMTAGESILAHYRNPLGYGIDRAAMDLRTWPPIAARILEMQTEKAEQRSAGIAKRVRSHRAQRMNGRGALHPI